MIPILAPILAQVAPAAVEAAGAVAGAAPDLLTVGGGALGGLGSVGGVALLLRWMLGTVEQRLSASDARVTALEGKIAELQRDLAVAAERDRGLREVLSAIRSSLERDR